MDAVKFFKEWKRMCDLCGNDCRKCSMSKKGNGDICTNVMRNEPEEAVAIVEKWSAEHPKMDRCPHCGSIKGMYSNLKIVGAKIFYGFDGSREEVWDVSELEGKILYCQNCYRGICKLEDWKRGQNETD